MPLTGQPSPQPDNAPVAAREQPSYWEWGKINPDLLAKLYTVDKHGNRINPYGTGEGYIVTCAITEGTLDVGSDYSSPFEANPDQRLPTLMGMIQAGELVSAVGNIANTLGNTKTGQVVGGVAAAGGAVLNVVTGGLSGSVFDKIGSKIKDTADAIQKLEGKTNLTKVNSVQIFVNTRPIELSLSLYFRAWKNAKTEVEEPISWLERWALPVSLSKDSIAENVSKAIANHQDALAGLFPSITPPFVALQYAKKTFLPFTVRSVSRPLVVERDKNMNALAVMVTVQLSSREAWDANDIKNLYGY